MQIETTPLFPEIALSTVVSAMPAPTPNPCGDPLSLLAYWPRGVYWKIHYPVQFKQLDSPWLKTCVKELQDKGWTHIHIIRIPLGDYPWNKPEVT